MRVVFYILIITPITSLLNICTKGLDYGFFYKTKREMASQNQLA